MYICDLFHVQLYRNICWICEIYRYIINCSVISFALFTVSVFKNISSHFSHLKEFYGWFWDFRIMEQKFLLTFPLNPDLRKQQRVHKWN